MPPLQVHGLVPPQGGRQPAERRYSRRTAAGLSPDGRLKGGLPATASQLRLQSLALRFIASDLLKQDNIRDTLPMGTLGSEFFRAGPGRDIGREDRPDLVALLRPRPPGPRSSNVGQDASGAPANLARCTQRPAAREVQPAARALVHLDVREFAGPFSGKAACGVPRRLAADLFSQSPICRATERQEPQEGAPNGQARR